ncbi:MULTISPECIES: ATP-binding protein [unclassified Streptomyces]|uniref:ATP-binding protein n=1 Tax=unclassified Streptomyces TaxID=2593676 RepID=UPI0028C39DB7|nr:MULTISPECIES: ATP-binding protein [unclassified Streptomyces]WNO71595.1 ATP-binding protein [Streptomyces sp. AM8-1-1]
MPKECWSVSADELTGPVHPVPQGPAEARREVEFLLHERFCRPDSDRDDPALTDALLVTSELVTNALLHGGGVTDFEAELTKEGVRVSVSDHSDEMPAVQERTDSRGRFRIGGHGWRVISRIARDVVITRHDGGGKRISVLVPLVPMM